MSEKVGHYMCGFCNYTCTKEKRFDLHCQTKSHLEKVEDDKKWLPMLKERLAAMGVLECPPPKGEEECISNE